MIDTLERIMRLMNKDASETFDASTDSLEAIRDAMDTYSVMATGKLTTSSTTVPADNARTETSDAFKGCLLMAIAGAAAFQPRLIVSYNSVGGVFTLDPGNPLVDAPGTSAYVILRHQEQFRPTVDGASNLTPADVIGGKADTATTTGSNTASLVRYAKGLLSLITLVRMQELDAANIPADIDTLLTRLSAARALLLDNLTTVRMQELDAANLPADIDGLKSSRSRQLFSLDFWGDPTASISVTNAAGDKALGTVTVVGIPAGATLASVTAIFKCRKFAETSAGANKLDGVQYIQVKETAAGAFTNAIKFSDDQFAVAASEENGGDVVMGNIDVKAEVDANGGYTFQWDDALADADGLTFQDIQIGLRVTYSV